MAFVQLCNSPPVMTTIKVGKKPLERLRRASEVVNTRLVPQTRRTILGSSVNAWKTLVRRKFSSSGLTGGVCGELRVWIFPLLDMTEVPFWLKQNRWI